MKKLFSILILSALCSGVYAQYCYWATDFGGSGNEENRGMTVDVNGNVIITGEFTSPSITIGSYTLINNNSNSTDYYIAKYDNNGNVLWAQRTGQNIDDVGRCVTTDAAGNIYVAGYFGTDTIFFGSLYVVNSAYGYKDIFVVKYDANGVPLWVRSSSGASDEVPHAITIDGGGNVVVAGRYHSGVPMTVGAVTIQNGSWGTNMFVCSWDSNGNHKWLKGAGKLNDDEAWGLDSDGGSGIYVTGYFRSDTLFIGSQYAVNNQNGNEDIFVAKLDTAGNTIYVKAFGGDDADFGTDVAVDAAGNCYLSAKWRSSSITVGSTTYSAPNNYDLLFVKLNPSGNVVWSQHPTGNAQDDSRGIDIDANGDVYASGEFEGNLTFATNSFTQTGGGDDLYIVKYSAAGVEQWATNVGYSGGGACYNIDVVGVNDLYISGYYQGTMPLGATTLTSAGGFDSYIAHIYQFTTAISSSGDITCFGANNGTATVSVTGGFSPYSYAWANNGQTTATATGMSQGHDTAFVTDANGCVSASVVLINEPSAITTTVTHLNVDCALAQAGSASVSVSGGTSPYTYTWTGGGTTSAISNLTPGTYIVTVTDDNGCTDMDSAVVISVATPAAPICMVTVDSTSQYNIIMWDESGFANADSFIVYREIATNDYRRIGARALVDSSYFIDTVRTLYAPNTGNPNNGTYRYKLQVLDTCGQLSAMSPYHNTIYIINTLGTFSWPQLYTIENGPNPVTNYVLWRDNVSDGNWVPVASVAGTQQVVNDPSYATYAATATWRVQTLWSISCTPTARFADPSFQNNWMSSFSNMQGQAIILNTQETIPAVAMSIYPTVTDGLFTLETQSYANAVVEIYSATGALVSSAQIAQQRTVLDLSGNAAGIYFVKLTSANGVITEKVVKQ